MVTIRRKDLIDYQCVEASVDQRSASSCCDIANQKSSETLRSGVADET